MQLRFIHAADIHLGYEQYNLAARANDFARAYLAMVDHAIKAEADFVLIAGDLFHRANADAWTLKQATEGLARLRDADVPVLAVEGNHDAQHYRKHLSWLEYLCDQGMLSLLNLATAESGFKSLVPFDPAERRGSYVDLAGARVYGIKYYGAATARILEQIQGELEPGPEGYTILMLHAGLEGQVPHLHGGLTPGQIEPLHRCVDYLALGHIHKRLFGEYEWVFNPGSTETNSMEEIDWPHGFFEVQVDTALPDKHEVHPIQTPTLRPFHRISISAEGIASLDEFVARGEDAIAAEPLLPERAVIELHLGGVAEFRRQDVPFERLKAAAEARFSPLLVRVRNNLVPPGLVSVRRHENSTRQDLERQVIGQLVYQHAAYRDSADAWTRLILDVKNMAAEKDLPANIADHVRTSIDRLHPTPLDTAEPGQDGSRAGDRGVESASAEAQESSQSGTGPDPEETRGNHEEIKGARQGMPRPPLSLVRGVDSGTTPFELQLDEEGW